MQCYDRDRIGVIVSILDIADGSGVSQAEIVNKANIPHRLFKEYLLFLYQHGLIQIQNIQHQRTYRTTSICGKIQEFGISLRV